MKTLIYYKTFAKDLNPLPESIYNYEFKLWEPGIIRMIPPARGKKYLIYWVFHFLKVFTNRDYSAVLVYEKDNLIASMLIVPAHFKWPFMRKDDLQFTFVMTHPEHRGKGIAEMMLRFAIEILNQDNRFFWYVTDNENIASIRLCTKVGFELKGYGEHSKLFGTKVVKIIEE